MLTIRIEEKLKRDLEEYCAVSNVTVSDLIRDLIKVKLKQKQYNPHLVVVWTLDTTITVKEYPFKEDAEKTCNEIALTQARKVVLAKIVREMS